MDSEKKPANANHNCEKIIQMILSLQIPAHEVMAAANTYIKKDPDLQSRRQKGILVMDGTQKRIGEKESRLCQFVYSYLMHTIQFIPLKNRETGDSIKEDEFKKTKVQLYHETISLTENFKHSRHPNTICWLLEILHILTNKISPPAGLFVQNASLGRQMGRLLEVLLQSAASIIQGADQLDFKQGEYHLQDLHLSPTVYEMLKRFEFSELQRETNSGRETLNE